MEEGESIDEDYLILLDLIQQMHQIGVYPAISSPWIATPTPISNSNMNTECSKDVLDSFVYPLEVRVFSDLELQSFSS